MVPESESVTTPCNRADARFQQLTEEFLKVEYAAHPVMATAMGVHAYDEYLDDFNRFALRGYRDQVRSYLHAIDKISLAELTASNRLDYRVARSSAQMTLAALEQQRWPERQPGIYLDTIFNGLFLLTAQDFAAPETRAIALIGRLRGIPNALAEARQNLQRPPAIFTRRAIETAEAGDACFTDTLPIFASSLRASGLRQMLGEAAQTACAALSEFLRFLREELLPRSDGEAALGKELYEYHLRVGHLLDKDRESSEALLAIGREGIREAKRRLERFAREQGEGQCWQELCSRWTQEPLPEGERLQAYRGAIQQAREFIQCRQLLSMPAKERLSFAETPCFARPQVPEIAYLPPAPFSMRPEGVFWVTPRPAEHAAASHPGEHSWLSPHALPLFALQKAYPGQHLQRCLAAQHPSRFRRHFAQSGVFMEGWALYCEAMMDEQGFLSDSGLRLLQLHESLKRSCLMAADIKFHTRQITLEEGVQFLQKEAGMREEEAETAMTYCACHPTQALAGPLGKRTLMTLREELERRLESRFDLRRFHDQILSYGSIPPTLLREALFSVI